MRLLFIYPYLPYPVTRGTFHRAFHLLRELARRHEIDLFCLDEEEAGAPHAGVFREFCARVHLQPFHHPPWPSFFPGRLFSLEPVTMRHWRDAAALEALHTFTEGRSYDLIHFCDLVMWPYARSVSRTLGVPAVMDRSRVDLLFQTEELRTLQLGTKERLLRKENLFKLRRVERQAAAELAATVVCGPDDETFQRAHISATAPVFVLANGCDTSFFSQSLFPPKDPKDPVWLFCGAMDYSPNVDALRWYFEAIDPLVLAQLPNRRIRIVGRNPVPAVQAYGKLPGVEVTGEVPDVRPHYQNAQFQMVPLRIGGGTRLKIVESLSIGCPVVSTTLGAQGLELEHARHILLADTPQAFADQIVLLARDPELRAQLRTAGREQVLTHYGWPMLAAKLEAHHQKLISHA